MSKPACEKRAICIEEIVNPASEATLAEGIGREKEAVVGIDRLLRTENVPEIARPKGIWNGNDNLPGVGPVI